MGFRATWKPPKVPLTRVPLNAHQGHQVLCSLVGQREAQHVWIWHSLKSGAHLLQQYGYCRKLPVDRKTSGRVQPWGQYCTPSETSRAVTNPDTHTGTKHALLFTVGGIHLIKGNQIADFACVCRAYGPVITLYHRVSHIVLHRITLESIMLYHVTIAHCIAFNCIIHLFSRFS